jgi:pyochelin biosynthesis protein PchC
VTVDSPWVRRLRPASVADEARCRLVCFPHAGGAATYFAPFAESLPASVDVLGLQYPGRQERLGERALDSIGALTDAVVAELSGWLDLPVAFFGHSMGATLAYEVARVLEDRGLVLEALFASGRRAPSTVRDERVHLGGDPSLLREVVRLGGTPAVLLDDEDVQQMILPALRGDYKAIETYVWEPGPPLSCPISAFLGAADPLTDDGEAAAWALHTTGDFELRVFPGGHFYLAAQVPVLAKLVAAAFD